MQNGRPRKLKRNVIFFLIILLLGLLNLRAKAQNPRNATIWTGALNSSWNHPGNWSGGEVPSITDDVVIKLVASPVVIVEADAFCKTLKIERSVQVALKGEIKLTIAGDLKNSGELISGKSTVIFKGNIAQAISASNPLTFYNLEVNNNSDTGIKANCKIKIVNELIMRAGNFATNDTVTVLNASGDAISVYSDKSYIAGKLQRKIKSSAFEKYCYPVGTGGKEKYFPAQIDAHFLEGTQWLTVSFEPLERYVQSALNASNSEMNIYSIATEGMWVLTPDIEPSGGWYNLKLWITNISGLRDNYFAILKRPTGDGPEAWTSSFGELSAFGGEGRKVADGYALRKYCTTFSEHTIGIEGSAIPIELLDFDARMESGIVNLTWSTATETNSAYFIIEKSNGTEFKEVARISAGGNSSVQRNYSAKDEKPFTGVSYYRLKQIDFDEKYEYSNIVSVKNESNGNQMILFPNPSERIFKIKFLAPVPKAEVVVFNQHGTISFNKIFTNPENNQTIELNLWDELPSGIYFLQVNTGSGDMAVQQIVIE